MARLRRHHDLGGTRYRMREKVFAIGDDFWIDTEDERHAFKVNGKALRLRSTFVLETPAGDELLTIQEKKLRVRDTMELEHDGRTVGTVRKALISPLRDRFTIGLGDGRELTAKGNIVDHEYEIERDGHEIAEISKRWFRIRDTYGIEIAPGEDDALILAAAVCIDEMAHD
ncbi:LURP-one-related/scramblase family protein [Candidatus Solirubrobacter pratensis]|uniref:LURP-one-related/scramblase family protein n=1 Tax=Candidatus Solirubrobacter pratensis TaxID=1298857 RepID=UPI000401D2EB|nr:LURP-one-related family protein [Candidatus Solirubrobacter pratensis]